MNLSTLTDHDETPEVLVQIQRDKRGNILCHLVDTSGNKVVLRFNPQAAHDLYDELSEILGTD